MSGVHPGWLDLGKRGYQSWCKAFSKGRVAFAVPTWDEIPEDLKLLWAQIAADIWSSNIETKPPFTDLKMRLS